MHTNRQHLSNTRTPAMMLHPFDHGWDACEQGKSLASNPYKSDTTDAQEWLDGFQSANSRRHLLAHRKY